MTRSLSLFAVVLAVWLSPSSPSQAQTAARTFVSGVGNDANPCSLTAPCRTFPAAISAVVSGGDVIVLDSAAYGENIAITKSVSITAPAGISARVRVSGSGDEGFIIFGNANLIVSLDGIAISGPSGGTGILFQSGKKLTLRNMDINIARTSSSTGVRTEAVNGSVAMIDSVLRNAQTCFIAFGNQGLVSATIVRSQFHGCQFGVRATDSSVVAVENSAVIGASRTDSNECTYNFYSEASIATTRLTLDNVVSTGCSAGIAAAGSQTLGFFGRVSVANSVISGNENASQLFTNGLGETYGNNRVRNNNTSNTLNFTVISQQ